GQSGENAQDKGTGIKKSDYGTYKLFKVDGIFGEQYSKEIIDAVVADGRESGKFGVWYLGDESYYEFQDTKVSVEVQKDGTIADLSDNKELNNMFREGYTITFEDGIICATSHTKDGDQIFYYDKAE
ncbi:MAG: hypothetical protein IJJ65_08355, partial [Butyrivibrio sp.]|nr:hypothetical protein [Butyrivibrio sp.]